MLTAERVWLLVADDVTGKPLSTVKSQVAVAAGLTMDVIDHQAARISDDEILTVQHEQHLTEPALNWCVQTLGSARSMRWGHAIDTLYTDAWDQAASSLQRAGLVQRYTHMLRHRYRVTSASTRIDLVTTARNDLDHGDGTPVSAATNYLLVLVATQALAMATSDPDLRGYTVPEQADSVLSHDSMCRRLGESVQYLLAQASQRWVAAASLRTLHTGVARRSPARSRSA